MPPLQSNLNSSIYGNPKVYDVAFSYRNYLAETTALLYWFKRYAGKCRPRSAIEFAAGPARHALELGRRGVKISALDLSPEMCAYASAMAAKQRIAMRVIQGDLVTYRGIRRYDLAIQMLDSISHVHTRRDLSMHFRNVADLLTSNGLYILEIGASRSGSTVNKWDIIEGTCEISVQWGSPIEAKYHANRSRRTTIQIKSTSKPNALLVSDILRLKAWKKRDVHSCLKQSGKLQIAAEFGGFTRSLSSASARAWRHILVLRKRSNALNYQPECSS